MKKLYYNNIYNNEDKQKLNWKHRLEIYDNKQKC